MMASASSSGKTPARQAATNSPTLWPIMALGRTPPAHPQPGQCILGGEEAGCASQVSLRSCVSPGTCLRRRISPHAGRFADGGKDFRAPVDFAAKERSRIGTAPPHLPVLGALTGEHEDDREGTGLVRAEDGGVPGLILEGADGILDVGTGDRPPVLERAAAHLQGVGDRSKVRVGVGLQVFGQVRVSASFSPGAERAERTISCPACAGSARLASGASSRTT